VEYCPTFPYFPPFTLAEEDAFPLAFGHYIIEPVEAIAAILSGVRFNDDVVVAFCT
jgi:hypothetical protein